MGQATKKLQLRRGDRKILEKWVRSRTLPRRQVDRAKILLGAARGLSSRELARTIDVARDTARLWIRRYEADGLDGVKQDRPRSGRPRKLTPELEAEIVERTIHEDPPPEVSTHWTSRLLADAMDLNHVDIWRTWNKYGLKPASTRRARSRHSTAPSQGYP